MSLFDLLVLNLKIMFTSGWSDRFMAGLEDGAGIMANVDQNLPANVKKPIQRNLVQGELMAPP